VKELKADRTYMDVSIGTTWNPVKELKVDRLVEAEVDARVNSRGMWNPVKELKVDRLEKSLDMALKEAWNPVKELKALFPPAHIHNLAKWNPVKELKAHKPIHTTNHELAQVESGEGIERTFGTSVSSSSRPWSTWNPVKELKGYGYTEVQARELVWNPVKELKDDEDLVQLPCAKQGGGIR